MTYATLQRRGAALIGAILALTFVGTVSATAQRDDSRGRGGGNYEAGVFDHYVLSLSWSPTHCAEQDPREQRDPQCAPRPPRPYAFVLHGLWPQFERGWPEFCRTRERPFVPDSIISRMMDVMPSRGLVIHQYRKHGTCSGLDPAGYFELSRKAFESIRIPDRFVSPAAPFTIGREEVIQAFLTANPKLQRDMVAVTCGGTGPRLQEVRICLGRDGAPRACGVGVDQRRLCRSDRVYVPPVRLGGGGASPAPSSREPAPLPPGLMPGGSERRI